MNSALRRRIALGIRLTGCATFLLAGPQSGHAAPAKRAAAKPAAKPAAEVTIKSKVSSFTNSVLLLTNGKRFRLDPIKTAVMTRRGKTPPTQWRAVILPGDEVTVVYDSKKAITRSVSIAPPYQLPNGEYEVLGQTTYLYSNPSNPAEEGKEVPLLWVKSTDPSKKARYVVELNDATALLGDGIEAGTTGSQAIKQMLQPKSIIQVLMFSSIHPTVDKYGDPESPTPVNGVVKQIKVTQAPEATAN